MRTAGPPRARNRGAETADGCEGEPVAVRSGKVAGGLRNRLQNDMRYEQRLIWVLGITFGFLFFDRNAASFLMPFITKDLSFSNQQVGLIASALSFTWAVSAFLGGAISDRTGKRKAILLTSVVAFSLCSFLSGLAGTFVALFAARLLMGARDVLPVSVTRGPSYGRRG